MILFRALHSLAAFITTPAQHRLLQALSAPDTVTRNVARTNTAGALGFVIGAGAAGMGLNALGATATFFACCPILILIVPLVLALRVSGLAGKQAKRGSQLREVKEGMQLLFGDVRLRAAACAVGFAFVIFHLFTAMLAPFVKFALGSDSSAFGLLRAMWSVGAIGGALALSLWPAKASPRPEAALRWTMAIGLTTVAFSQIEGTLSGSFLLLMIGASFAVARSFVEGLVLTHCAPEMVGRAKSNINALTTLCGVVVYLLPILVGSVTPRWLFFGVGVAVLAASAALSFASRSRDAAVVGMEPS